MPHLCSRCPVLGAKRTRQHANEMSAFDAKPTGLGLSISYDIIVQAAQRLNSGRFTAGRVYRNQGYPAARCCVRLRSARSPLLALRGHGFLHRTCLLVTEDGHPLPQGTTLWMREFDRCRSRPSASQVAGIALMVADLRQSHAAEALRGQFIAANNVSGSRQRNEFELPGFPCWLPLTPRSPPRQPLVKQGCHGLPGSFFDRGGPVLTLRLTELIPLFEPNEMLGTETRIYFVCPLE